MLYAGSDIGVFVSSNGGSTWNPFGTGLPRVAVFDMAFQGPNRLVRIATHGRGAWENAAAKAQALVTVAASPSPSVYGGNVTFTATVNPNGVLSNPTGTVTFTDGSTTLGSAGITGSGPFTASFSTNLLSAGTHPITATFNGDNIFDVSVSAPLSFVVNPAPLTITADDATKILNAPNPATFTATYSGFVLGEGPSALSGTLSCTTTAVTNSPVGGYPITCSGQTSTNYAITYVAGTLHVIFAPDGVCVKDKEPSHQILQPINADGSSVFNGNGPIDVKFRVCDANGVSQGTGVSASIRLTNKIQGTLNNTVDLPVDPKPGTNGFVFGEDQLWLFRIDSKQLAGGFTYVFRIDLNDGSHIDFQFGRR